MQTLDEALKQIEKSTDFCLYGRIKLGNKQFTENDLETLVEWLNTLTSPQQSKTEIHLDRFFAYQLDLRRYGSSFSLRMEGLVNRDTDYERRQTEMPSKIVSLICRILASPGWQTIALTNNGWTDGDSQRLLSALRSNVTVLRHLNWSGNVIRQKSVKMLVSLLAQASALKYLTLQQCSVQDVHIKTILSAIPSDAPLTVIDLRGNFLETEGANFLSTWLKKHPNVTEVFYDENRASVDTSFALANFSVAELATLKSLTKEQWQTQGGYSEALFKKIQAFKGAEERYTQTPFTDEEVKLLQSLLNSNNQAGLSTKLKAPLKPAIDQQLIQNQAHQKALIENLFSLESLYNEAQRAASAKQYEWFEFILGGMGYSSVKAEQDYEEQLRSLEDERLLHDLAAQLALSQQSILQWALVNPGNESLQAAQKRLAEALADKRQAMEAISQNHFARDPALTPEQREQRFSISQQTIIEPMLDAYQIQLTEKTSLEPLARQRGDQYTTTGKRPANV